MEGCSLRGACVCVVKRAEQGVVGDAAKSHACAVPSSHLLLLHLPPSHAYLHGMSVAPCLQNPTQRHAFCIKGRQQAKFYIIMILYSIGRC